MEKPTKKSTLKPKLQKAKATAASFLYGHPSKHLKIIIITGTSNNTLVATFIHKILLANNQSSAIIYSPEKSSISSLNLQSYLSKALKNNISFAIIEAPENTVKNHTFHNLPIHMAVLTNTAITPENPQTPIKSSRLFSNLPDFIVLNHDDLSFKHLSTFPAKKSSKSYGRHKESDTRINRSKLYKKGAEANLSANSTAFDVATFISDESAANHMAAAATAALLLDIPPEAIVEGIASYEP